LTLPPLAGAAALASPALWRRTWLLDAPSALRTSAPAAPNAAEIDELLDLADERTPARLEAIARWAGRPAVLPWTEMLLDLFLTAKPSPVRAARALALLHVAMSDAVAVVHDANEIIRGPAPPAEVAELALPGAGDAFAFPSAQAAVAGAAASVLSYLFPAESARFAAAEDEAALSRLWAGASFRSDVQAGLDIGRAVGALAVARGRNDGSDAEWTGGMPTGEGSWQPTPPRYVPVPSDPLAGTWKTWVLPSGDALRPPPPRASGTLEWKAELAGVQAAVANRTPEQAAAAEFWAGGPGTVTPAGLWIEIARELIARDGLDTIEAATILAVASVAMADAFTCCWDTKFTYWTARPVSVDPTLDVLIVTPPFPSYTSGHSTISAAAATVLGDYFPDDAADLAAKAVEAKTSRLWAGIHFGLDNETGAAGGKQVGEMVLRAVLG
jgi:membrane-associated phospholipid phosphatase